MIQPRKKLIEVTIPLEAINKESAREKSIRHGHPSTLHLWWARRPLAACRAVLFASLVDDPSSCPEEFPTEASQEAERQRLFDIIEDLVKWDNSTNVAVLHRARVEIARSTARAHNVSLPHSLTPDEVADALRRYAPPVLDPFAGGGSIPLEAQRLGLEAHASDLNPVAVLINKALIEIPPKFANRPPVHPEENKTLLQREWRGAQGLAEDVRYYGKWMHDEAWKRIGQLYPKVTLPKEQGGGEATVIAWLWARTVQCPNPACGAQMPLVRSFALSTKKGKEVYVEPIVDQATKTVRFEVRQGKGAPEGTRQRGASECLFCNNLVTDDDLRRQATENGLAILPLAIVCESKGGRIYLPFDRHSVPEVLPVDNNALNVELPKNPRWFSPPSYGINTYYELFTYRQLLALTTFCELAVEARKHVLTAALLAGLNDDNVPLDEGGTGASAYADSVATYLAFGVSKASSRNCTFAIWESGMDRLAGALGRQALPMSWDFAETNPLAGAGGDIYNGPKISDMGIRVIKV
ncbi:MAG TPA: DUF1156 domain-containing protein [Ktedonobacteraceae bacterium]|jgi:putative DNA methylase